MSLKKPEPPRYSWTQPCCNQCWNERNPDRHPTRLLQTKNETCVFCGQPNRSGIYVRINPVEAPHPTLVKE